MGDKIAFEIKEGRVKVRFYGSKTTGLYQLGDESGTGKTRLCNLLIDYGTMGLPVTGYSYRDYVRGQRLHEYRNKGLKMIVIDRYDMYNGEMESDIIELSKECIVLIDCKAIPDIAASMDYKDINMYIDHIDII